MLQSNWKVFAYLGTILAEQFINERSIPYTNRAFDTHLQVYQALPLWHGFTGSQHAALKRRD